MKKAAELQAKAEAMAEMYGWFDSRIEAHLREAADYKNQSDEWNEEHPDQKDNYYIERSRQEESKASALQQLLEQISKAL